METMPITATLWMRNPVLDVLKAAEELADKTPVARQFAAALDAARVQKLWTSLVVTREQLSYAIARAPEIREALAAEAEASDDKETRAAARKMLALFDGYVRWTADAMQQIERKERLLASLEEAEPAAEAAVDEQIGDSPAAAEAGERGRRRKEMVAA